MPARAVVRSFPAVERNHMIWGLAPPGGQAALLRGPGGRRVRRPPSGRRSWSGISMVATPAARKMAENKRGTAARTSSTCTARTRSRRRNSSPTGAYKRAVGGGGKLRARGLSALGARGAAAERLDHVRLEHDPRSTTDCVHVRWIFTSPRSLGGATAAAEGGRHVSAPAAQPGHPNLGEQGVPRSPGTAVRWRRTSASTGAGPSSSTRFPVAAEAAAGSGGDGGHRGQRRRQAAGGSGGDVRLPSNRWVAEPKPAGQGLTKSRPAAARASKSST